MTTYIYADLLFTINLLADYIILYLTSRLTCSRTSIIRLLLGAMLGAAFGTVSVCISLSGVPLALLVIAIPVAMCIISFGRKRKRPFISLIFFFYISSVLLYGGMYAMHSFLSVIFKNVPVRSVILIIILMLAVFFIYIITSSFLSRGIKHSSSNVKVEMCDGLKTYTLDFLCDSGNLAKDPFSGKPVTIVRRTSVDAELVSALTDALSDKKDHGKYSYIKPRVIPLKTVSGATLLYAFVPKSMFVYIGKEKKPLDTIVAIDNRDNAFFGKDGIISGELIETL